jgi:antitoxin (DNA-binding transcriptional repressor) of toxin-antitoxin stability system
MRTCEICPGAGTPVDNIFASNVYVENTIVKAGEVIVIANVNRAVVDLYTLTGQLVKTQHIESPGDLVKSTSIPGVYLLQVTTSTEIFTTKIIITE